MDAADIHILGGGPAGLTAGYYAKKQNLNFVLYEAGTSVGGNCRTIRLGDFRFDTGAHRFHDKDPIATAEVNHLLGDDLLKVDAPSEIFFDGKFYRFPLELRDLIDKLGYKTLLRIAWEKLQNGRLKVCGNFEELALNRYGRTLAERFLTNYSEKLWGLPTSQLSTSISGNRLKGLDLRSFIRATLLGRSQNTVHLDGSFYYPKYGIGMIPDSLYQFIGKEHVKKKHSVSRILHKDGKISCIVLNNEIEIETPTVINTLPLTLSMRILDPAPPVQLFSIAERIKFRHLILCVFCLNRDSFSPNASLYFPSADFPFTRLYEPKNRSASMAPSGQTVIVLEIPCFKEDTIWNNTDFELHSKVWNALRRVNPLEENEITNFQIYRLPYAYPVLEVGFEENIKQLVDYFEQFENLYLTGRSSLFSYIHLHDLFKAGKEVIEQIVNS